MKSNPLLRWGAIPAIGLILFGLIRLLSGERDPETSSGNAPTLSEEERRALGIEGDTPQDTVATLVAQVRQLRNELNTTQKENQRQQSENQRLRQASGQVDQRIARALNDERKQQQQSGEQAQQERQQLASRLEELQQRLEHLSQGDEIPPGLGLDDETVPDVTLPDMRWTEPDDRPADTNKPHGNADKHSAFPTRFALPDDTEQPQEHEAVIHPVYTVPANATLMGSVAMTALIGRVPVDGTVNDPYPFKALIGADNLTANGIELPDVAGAVVSGTASGDWTLSCVRGQIRSITFVFQDGTIRTLPSGDRQSKEGDGTSASLGWISDPYGIPCVGGERRSNAQQYLGTQALLTAAGAGVAALVNHGDDDTMTLMTNSDGSLGSVGMTGNEAMNQILAGGVRDMSQWVNKLYGQAFAAVYVRPGAQVAIHIDRPLQIDYDENGRRVRHTGGENEPPLD
ncbi:TIGR03752 family integrating conjugative element protein [Salmonella enterica]